MCYHCSVPADAIEVQEFLDASGRSPFAQWFARLNSTAAAKVTAALYRLALGNFSNVEGVGSGVYEYKIDFGPGYRIYFGKDGDRIVILLGGSDKKRQTAAIAKAQIAWATYSVLRRLERKIDTKGEQMALTKDFRETTYARAQRDASYRKALLTEAVNAYLGGEEAIGKAILRDFINATIGFEELAAAVRIPAKSLHRMLGPNGNPSTANFFAVLRVLQEKLRMHLTVRAA